MKRKECPFCHLKNLKISHRFCTPGTVRKFEPAVITRQRLFIQRNLKKKQQTVIQRHIIENLKDEKEESKEKEKTIRFTNTLEEEEIPSTPNGEEEDESSRMYNGIDLTYVHAAYLEYKPEDIATISDKATLMKLNTLYHPHSCPFWEDEYEYITLMSQALTKRFKELGM